MESALSYAIERLSVETIAVCGHSGCEAMHDLLHGRGGGAIGQWLQHGAGSLAALRDDHPVARAALHAGFGDADQLSVANVAKQVQALQGHPLVAPRMAQGSVTVVGLFLDLGTARLYRVGSDHIAEISKSGGYLDGVREVAH